MEVVEYDFCGASSLQRYQNFVAFCAHLSWVAYRPNIENIPAMSPYQTPIPFGDVEEYHWKLLKDWQRLQLSLMNSLLVTWWRHSQITGFSWKLISKLHSPSSINLLKYQRFLTDWLKYVGSVINEIDLWALWSGQVSASVLSQGSCCVVNSMSCSYLPQNRLFLEVELQFCGLDHARRCVMAICARG